MGTKLLEKWESRGFRRDILLSMALAQCGLATDTFAVQQVNNICTSNHLSLLRPSVRTSCCCLQVNCMAHLLMLPGTNSRPTVVRHQSQCMCYQQTVQSTAKYKSCTRSCTLFSAMHAALVAQYKLLPEQMLANKFDLVKWLFGPILLTNDAKHPHNPRMWPANRTQIHNKSLCMHKAISSIRPMSLAILQVSAGCARMEEALVLLNDGGAPPLAPALQQEIHDSLQDLRPQCILDHLKVCYWSLDLSLPRYMHLASV